MIECTAIARTSNAGRTCEMPTTQETQSLPATAASDRLPHLALHQKGVCSLHAQPGHRIYVSGVKRGIRNRNYSRRNCALGERRANIRGVRETRARPPHLTRS